MASMDGDKAYDTLKSKIDSGAELTKQDLMSIVLLPLMKNSVDRSEFEKAFINTKTRSKLR